MHIPASAGSFLRVGLSVLAGRDLAEARAMIPGNKEFGEWCSQNFWEQNIETLRLLRIRFEVFGARQDEMREAGIGVSSQYLLASDQYDDCRDLAEALAIDGG